MKDIHSMRPWIAQLLFSVTLATVMVCQPASADPLQLKPYDFENHAGETVNAQWGEFDVPLKHGVEDGKTITLSFVRFPSTSEHPGNPIVYLAGGPGGSGIAAARGKRFALFMALRKVADVIALDLRGTGASDDIPACSAAQAFPLDRPVTGGEPMSYVAYARAAIDHCVAFWHQQGVDLSAYNTHEIALDLEDLRKALGAEKLNLWGISYGSQLALAALRTMPKHIDRVVLASPLDLHQTMRLPARTQDFLTRVDALVKADAQAAKAYPNLLGTMSKVLDQLDHAPVRVALPPGEGDTPVTMSLNKFAVQAFTLRLLKNPDMLGYLPAAYYAMAAGQFAAVAKPMYAALSEPLALDGMGLAVRAASCLSPERAQQIDDQAKATLLDNSFNRLTELFREVEVPRLDPDFCKPVQSEVPALVLTGTLDGRTYPAGHAEILRGLSSGTQVVIENAGHDLFMSSPKITADIAAFLRHEPVPYERIRIAAPHFVLPPQTTQ